MLGKHHQKSQVELFRSGLDQMISLNQALVVLSKEVDWNWIETELKGYYSREGRPSIPIRTIVGMLLLKQLYNQSDESVLARWVENPYWQYFTGETHFQHKPPFDPTDFVYFRKRVGKPGMEKVLGLTVKLHPGSEDEPIVQIDTTVQEKNITFPTDTKLQHRIIEYLWWIANREQISLRQSYRFVLKKLRLKMHNGYHPARRKQANKARKKVKIICGRVLRDIERKLNEEQRAYYQPWLDLYRRVLAQKRYDKNKIYSLHEPEVYCVAKGKAHKKYEFGCKIAVVRGANSGVITGMNSFEENIYDGHTLDPALAQSERIRQGAGGSRPQVAVVDRGCKGRKWIKDTQIMIPGKPTKGLTAYEKRKLRKLFRSRAGIEPIIGHLKQDHRMQRNYLSGVLGDAVNALLAGAAFNLKMRLNQLKEELKSIFDLLINALELVLLRSSLKLTSQI